MTNQGLPPDILALLDAERARPNAPSEHVEAALERFYATLGGPSGPGGGAPPASGGAPDASGASSAAGRSTSLLARVAGPLLGVVLGAAGGVVVTRATQPEPVAELTRAPTPRLLVIREPAPVPSQPLPPAQASSHAEFRVLQGSRPAAVESSLQAERVLLERARAALLRGDIQAALSAVALHEQRYPDGQLTEERNELRQQAQAQNDGGRQ